MCKNCQYHFTHIITHEQLSDDLKRHKVPEGYSGYPGARECFNRYLDDKETIEAIIERAKKENWVDLVILGSDYRSEHIKKLKKFIGLEA